MPIADELVQCLHFGHESELMDDAADAPGLAGRRAHRFGLRDAERERFFAKYVFAHRQRRHHVPMMSERRRCDGDGVEFDVLEHLGAGCEGVLYASLLRDTARIIRRSERHHVEARVVLQCREMREHSKAGPDDTDAKSLHRHCLCRLRHRDL